MPSTPPVRLARWSATHPWRALSAWFAFVAVAVTLMMTVPTQQTSDKDFRYGESGEVAAILDDAGLTDPPSEVVLITSPDGALDESAATTVASELDTSIRNVAGVDSVGDLVWSADRDAALVPITMTGTADDAGDHVGDVLDATAAVAKDHPELDIVQSGSASIDDGIWTRVGEDLGSAEALSLPITLLIMIVAFGALIAAGIPVLLAVGSVVTALGLYAPISLLFPDGGTVANVVLMIGMAVGVDYSLFYLKREREERARGRSTIDAIEIAAATAGHAVIVSGLAVMVSMAGLFLAFDPTFSSMAAGSIIVVAVAVLGSLTFLPGILGLLGHRVDRPRVPLLWRLNRRIGAGGISRRLIRPVVAHPRIAAVLAIAVLAGLAVPALGMTMQDDNLDSLPQDIPAVAAAQRLESEFPSERPSVDIVIRHDGDGTLDPTVARSTLESVGAAAHDAGIAEPSADGVRISDDGSAAVLSLESAFGETDPRLMDMVEQLRDELVPRASTDGTEVLVGGDAARYYDHENRTNTLPLVIAFVLVLTLVMMWWTFRSVTIALLTTGLNLLSVGASFGVLTLVFQHTWAEGLLDFTSTGFIIDWIPLFCFVILVGLSMDYHVFVLSRVREGLRSGLSFDDAVAHGVRDTASVVTSAAVVMVSVFAVFATLSMLEMKMMGIGLSVAIALDATVVRLVLLPASLLLLRRRLGRLDSSAASERKPEPVLVGAS